MARKLTLQVVFPSLEVLYPVDLPELPSQDPTGLRLTLEALDGACFPDEWFTQWVSISPAPQNSSLDNNRQYRSRQQHLKKRKGGRGAR